MEYIYFYFLLSSDQSNATPLFVKLPDQGGYVRVWVYRINNFITLRKLGLSNLDESQSF